MGQGSNNETKTKYRKNLNKQVAYFPQFCSRRLLNFLSFLPGCLKEASEYFFACRFMEQASYFRVIFLKYIF